jgi:hypothetical protein
MAITSYAQLQSFLSTILTTNQQMNSTKNSPHKDFWNNMTYAQFVGGNVPGVNPPLPILVKGNSAGSNLILALQGQGPLFNAAGMYGQMPGDGPPFFTADQIKQIADWIDAGCPE